MTDTFAAEEQRANSLARLLNDPAIKTLIEEIATSE